MSNDARQRAPRERTFLFVDRVGELVRNARIVAHRHLSPSEEIFRHHFPGRPIMPASLLIEACAQTATVLLEVSGGFRNKAFVGYVRQAKFRHAVEPGCGMTIALEVESLSGDGAVLRGGITQGDRRCASAELGMALAPLEGFYRPEHWASFCSFYRDLLEGTRFGGFAGDPLERLSDAAL